MLISSRRYSVSHEFISLPRWILAPLGLSAGKTAYLALNKYKPTEGTKVGELVISPFPPDLWGDLWRIQVQFASGTGQVAHIAEFLETKGFDILAFEAYEGGRFEPAEDRDETPLNSFHLIVSGKFYRSPNDGTSKQRYESPFFRMRDLYDEMSIEFINRLNFVNRKTPRLTIRRLAQHRILKHEREAQADRHTHSNIGLPVEIRQEPDHIRQERERKSSDSAHVLASEGSGVLGFATLDKEGSRRETELSVALGELLSELSDKGNQITIMPTADAYERLIRIIPDKVTKPEFGHVVVIKGDGEPTPLKAIGQSLSDLDANIIKVQLRRGHNKYANKILDQYKTKLRDVGAKATVDDKPGAAVTQIDVTFSWPPSVGALHMEGFWSAFEHNLRRSFGTWQFRNPDSWRRTFAVWNVEQITKPQGTLQNPETDEPAEPSLTSKALKTIECLSEERGRKQKKIAREQPRERKRYSLTESVDDKDSEQSENDLRLRQERQETELAMLTAKLQHIKRVALNQIEIGKAVKGPSIFVSYSQNGAPLMEKLLHISQRHLASEIISNGFDGSYDDTKIAVIWRRIAECDAFIGIWTADLPLDENFSNQDIRRFEGSKELVWRKQRQGLPSPWLPFEWGMAVSLGKPFYLLIEKGVPESYSLRVAGDVPHYLGAFSMTPDSRKEDFTHVAEEALTASIFRYFKKLGIISDFIDGVTHGS